MSETLPHAATTSATTPALVTMDGAQGANLLELTKPALALPIHNDDYPVFTSPVTDFEKQTALRPDVAGCRVVVPVCGQEQPLTV